MVILSKVHFVPRSDLGPTCARSLGQTDTRVGSRRTTLPAPPPRKREPYILECTRETVKGATFPKAVTETIFLAPIVSAGSRLALTHPADLCYLKLYVAPAIERRVAGTSGRIARFGWMLPVITPPTPGGGTPLGFRLPFLFVRLFQDPGKPLFPLAFARLARRNDRPPSWGAESGNHRSLHVQTQPRSSS